MDTSGHGTQSWDDDDTAVAMLERRRVAIEARERAMFMDAMFRKRDALIDEAVRRHRHTVISMDAHHRCLYSAQDVDHITARKMAPIIRAEFRRLVSADQKPDAWTPGPGFPWL